MRAFRAVLLVIVLLIVAFIAFGWWTGSSSAPFHTTIERATGTSGAIDMTKARERGAEAGEKAAEAAAVIKESVDEAAITSKIKAKMALDDNVRARSIDVSTSGTTVTVSGTVRSQEEHERAIKLARDTQGVTRVIDRLTVKP